MADAAVEATDQAGSSGGKTPQSIDDIIDEQTLKFTMVGDEGPEDEEAPDEDSETDSAETQKAEETESEAASETEDEDEDSDKPDEETAETETTGTGIDATLRYLEENNPDLVRSVRDLQANFTERSQDIAQFERDKAELTSILDEVRTVKEQEEATAEETSTTPEEEEMEDPLADVPAHQRELFEKGFDYYARQQGLVRQTDLDAEKTQEESRAVAADQADFIKGANAEAIEIFGDRLVKTGNNGTLNESTLAGETKERLVSARDRISNTRKGLTWGDVFKAEFYKDDVKAAEDKGYQRGLKESSDKTKSKVAQARKGRTVSGSRASGSPQKPLIYDPKKDKENMERVIDRAFRFAESHID
jgi:hypothetical protein